jgi:hypothetical protein
VAQDDKVDGGQIGQGANADLRYD